MSSATSNAYHLTKHDSNSLTIILFSRNCHLHQFQPLHQCTILVGSSNHYRRAVVDVGTIKFNNTA
jgi:hypothetical protein